MSSIEGRLDKLERTTREPKRTIFFWQEGDGLTAEQKAYVAEAEARGTKVMIFGWGDRDGDPPDLNEFVSNASDDELRDIITSASRAEGSSRGN